MSLWKKDFNKIRKYFEENPDYNGVIHILAGIGIGILITYPLIGEHPVRWSIIFLTAALVGHLYPITFK